MATKIPPEQVLATKRQKAWQQHISTQYSLLEEKRFDDSSLTFEWVTETMAAIGTFPTEEDQELGHTTQLQLILPEVTEPGSRRFEVESEVNKARAFTKGDQTYVAALCGNGWVYVFNISNKKLQEPIIIIKEHKENGFGLAWSAGGLLATGTGDSDSGCGAAYVWAIDFAKCNKPGYKESTDGLAYAKAYTLEYDESIAVNDVCWCGENLVVGSEDGKIRLYSTNGKLLKACVAYDGDSGGGRSVDVVSSSPIAPNMFATAGGDNSAIKIWLFRALMDPKKDGHPYAVLRGHNATVTCLRFSPFLDGVLASGAEDGQVLLWNLKDIGKFQRLSANEVAVPEILYSHGGHILSISDICWHTKRPRVLGTMSEDCRLQVWTPQVLNQIESIMGGDTDSKWPPIPEIPDDFV